MNKVFEKVLEVAVGALVKIIDRVDRRRERPARPPLDYKLQELEIEEAVRKAEAERRAKYNAH